MNYAKENIMTVKTAATAIRPCEPADWKPR